MGVQSVPAWCSRAFETLDECLDFIRNRHPKVPIRHIEKTWRLAKALSMEFLHMFFVVKAVGSTGAYITSRRYLRRSRLC